MQLEHIPFLRNCIALADALPVEGGTTPVEDDTTPVEDDTTPAEGDTIPVEGDTPPVEGDTTPVEDDMPPAEDDTLPVEGGTTPVEDDMPPAEDDTPPVEGDTTPVTGGEMQEILDGLRESLNQKDADVENLTDSVRSLVDVMSMEASQASDVYVPPDIPISGYETWGYPVTVDYMVSIVGFEELVPETQTYDTPSQFLEDYQNFAHECFLGSTFKDFYIDKVQDSSGTVLYDSNADVTDPPEEEPVEDLHPAILETLQSMDAHLATMDNALADIASVSENSIAFYEDSVKLYKQGNELLAHTLAVDLALLFVVVFMLGHRIAHAFWQRMRTG